MNLIYLETGNLSSKSTIEVNGLTMTISQLSSLIGRPTQSIDYQLRAGKTVEEIVEASKLGGKQIHERHGRYGTPEHTTWQKMKDRCTNPNNDKWERYGGRGIKVCPEWLNSFQAFFDYVGEKPHPEYTLDRIDADGDYEPGNVRWASVAEQNNNTSRNRIVEYKGGKLTAKQLSKLTGQSYSHVLYHANKGKTGDEIAVTPMRDRGDRAVQREDVHGNVIETYPSIKAAAKASGVPQTTIRRQLEQMYTDQEWRVMGDETERVTNPFNGQGKAKRLSYAGETYSANGLAKKLGVPLHFVNEWLAKGLTGEQIASKEYKPKAKEVMYVSPEKIEVYNSISEASKATGVSVKTIRRECKQFFEDQNWCFKADYKKPRNKR